MFHVLTIMKNLVEWGPAVRTSKVRLEYTMKKSTEYGAGKVCFFPVYVTKIRKRFPYQSSLLYSLFFSQDPVGFMATKSNMQVPGTGSAVNHRVAIVPPHLYRCQRLHRTPGVMEAAGNPPVYSKSSDHPQNISCQFEAVFSDRHSESHMPSSPLIPMERS